PSRHQPEPQRLARPPHRRPPPRALHPRSGAVVHRLVGQGRKAQPMDTVDIAVVGGGIVGALVAREAAAAFPDADIAVLERGLIGQGASARSAGVHFPRGATERVRAMTEHSERYWTEAAIELGLPIHRVDATVVADRSAEEIETTYLRL